MSRFTCAGVAVDALSLEGAAAEVLRLGRERTGGAVHLANAWSLACAARDPAHRRILEAGDLVLADGMPLVWTARHLGFPLAERVYGPDLLDRVVAAGVARGTTHHLYGAAAGVAARAADRLRERHHGAEVVATDAPPFGPLTDPLVDEAAARITEVGAQIVWVALGTPKQDEFVHRLRDRVAAPLVGVGAAFDFLAGAKPQAPALLRRAGLEWAFRLASEPRRLGYRYVVGNAVFVRALVRERPRRLPDQRVTSS